MPGSLWTTRRRRAVERFVREAQTRLRLADWDVRLDFENPAPEGALASIAHASNQRRATLQFGAEFLQQTPADQRHTLVHELVHCHLFDLHDTAVAVAEAGSSRQRDLAKRLVNDRVEWATDALADAMVALVADVPVPGSVAPLTVREEAVPAAAEARPGEQQAAPEPSGELAAAKTRSRG